MTMIESEAISDASIVSEKPEVLESRQALQDCYGGRVFKSGPRYRLTGGESTPPCRSSRRDPLFNSRDSRSDTDHGRKFTLPES
jgi:hypothetical protein